MRSVRWLAIVVIVGLLVAAAVLEREDRDIDTLTAPLRPGVAVATPTGGTWYCPGGSGADPDGIAGVGLEIVNAGDDAAVATVSALYPGLVDDANETVVSVDPGGRTPVRLAGLAPQAAWVGAVVEVDGADVVVEQTFAGASGSDRTPCSTRTASSWVVPFGATRVESAGERMVLLLLNPFPDDAIVDIAYDADVGVDSLAGLVVPARRLVAVDVTDADTGVTVAARLSAVIDVTSGRLAISRVQTYDGDQARGLAVVPASAAAAVTYLPTVGRAEGRKDTVSVTNPGSVAAEVDIEILADGDVSPDPIELTVLPGRTVQVDLATETRLAELTSFGLVVRSLGGAPVSASVDSVVDPLVGDMSIVVGAASSVGADVAATRWLVPVDGGASEQGSVVVVNPSPSAIATVTIESRDGEGSEIVSEVELGPGRRAVVAIADIAGDRPVVVVESSSPVVAGRITAGLTSRSMAVGTVASEPVDFATLR